jgi:hypothetical protein
MAYDINYKPPDLLVPLVQHLPGIGLVPTSLGRQVLARASAPEQMSEIVNAMGRGAKPSRSILLEDPDTESATIVIADGHTEMAELEDLANETFERNAIRRRKFGSSFDFDGARERAGQPAREKMAAIWHDAIAERIRKHKENPVTDPFRQPYRPPPENGATKHFFGDASHDER